MANSGRWAEETCTCDYEWLDPLVIPLDGHPVRLTNLAGGVWFDIDGDGVRDRVAWTVAGARVGLLVLDRNGNGAIDSIGELFGQVVSGHRRPGGAANSFADLAAFDRPESGGNGDGVISAADAVYAQLRLWVDRNHDGVSQPGELVTLAQAGLASIELAAQPVGRRDRFGNYFKYRAVAHRTSGAPVPVWDVFLVARLGGSAPPSAAGLSWPGGSWPGPVSTTLAGLGAGLIALGFAALNRSRRRSARAGDLRFAPGRARLGVTGITTAAVVLLWPAASFGQQAWQVVEYYDTDALGSVRAVTDSSGQIVKDSLGHEIGRHDFLPFGEELAPQSPPHDKKLFTGQERDFETGQDYFNARQLRTDLGRFMSPDPLGGHMGDPQSLSRYVYVRNSPLMLVDPTGLDFYLLGGDQCNQDKGPNCDKAGYVLDAGGNRVQIGNAQLRDPESGITATFDQSGVHITTSQGSFAAHFATDTEATRIEGSGAFAGMHAVFNSDCGGTCVAGGSLFGTRGQFDSLMTRGSLTGANPGIDVMNMFHLGTTQFRGGNIQGPDAHLSYAASDDPYQQDPFHIDNRYPYGSLSGFAEHALGVLRTIWNKITFRRDPERPQDIPTASVPRGR